MDKFLPTLVIVAVLVLIFIAMWWGWRRRSERDAALNPLTVVPADLGAVRAASAVFYVATTEHEKPLERLAIRGFAFRGRGELTVADSGIVVAVQGEKDVFIPADALQSVEPATVAIDRVVEKGGLLRLIWRIRSGGSSNGPLVDSYFRVIEPAERGRLIDAISQLMESEV